MNVFAESSYRILLDKAVREKKRDFGSQYSFSRMADYCRIQKTYLSKVIHEEAHLNEDQLYLSCDFLNFSEEEIDFCQTLMSFDKAQLPKRRNQLELRIKNIQAKKLNTEESLEENTQIWDTDNVNTYHLNPLNLLVHMYLTIETYSKEPRLIANELNLSMGQLQEVIQQLKELKVVVKSNDGYEVLQKNLHLSKESKLYPAFRSLMKLKTLEKLSKNESEDYSFSVFFSSDKETQKKIHQDFLEYLKKTQKRVGQSKAEKVYQLSFDLVSW